MIPDVRHVHRANCEARSNGGCRKFVPENKGGKTRFSSLIFADTAPSSVRCQKYIPGVEYGVNVFCKESAKLTGGRCGSWQVDEDLAEADLVDDGDEGDSASDGPESFAKDKMIKAKKPKGGAAAAASKRKATAAKGKAAKK